MNGDQGIGSHHALRCSRPAILHPILPAAILHIRQARQAHSESAGRQLGNGGTNLYLRQHNSLYFCDLNVFSDGSFAYSDVSLSSSYEAAKAAYNKAVTAQATAEQALSNTEVIVGTQTGPTGSWTGVASFSSLRDGQQIRHVEYALGVRVIKYDCEGQDVKLMQDMLLKLGYDLGSWGVDGDFGDCTDLALRAFQTDAKLDVDGECGPATLVAMEKAVEALDSASCNGTAAPTSPSLAATATSAPRRTPMARFWV